MACLPSTGWRPIKFARNFIPDSRIEKVRRDCYPSLAKDPLHEAFYILLEEETSLKRRLDWVRGRIAKMRKHMEHIQASAPVPPPLSPPLRS